MQLCYIIQVVSIKAIGIAIKLTLDGISQIAYPQTWFFLTVAAVCVITQLNYLNKVSRLLNYLNKVSLLLNCLNKVSLSLLVLVVSVIDAL